KLLDFARGLLSLNTNSQGMALPDQDFDGNAFYERGVDNSLADRNQIDFSTTRPFEGVPNAKPVSNETVSSPGVKKDRNIPDNDSLGGNWYPGEMALKGDAADFDKTNFGDMPFSSDPEVTTTTTDYYMSGGKKFKTKEERDAYAKATFGSFMGSDTSTDSDTTTPSVVKPVERTTDKLPITNTDTISKMYDRITNVADKSTLVVDDAKQTLAVIEKLDPVEKPEFFKSLFQDRERMLYLALAFNTMRLDPDDGLTKVIGKELEDLRKGGNQSVAYLKKYHPDIYKLVEQGMSVKDAVSIARLKQPGAIQVGSIPKDYILKQNEKGDAYLEVIPGSKTALELKRKDEARQSSVLGKIDKVEMMNTNIDEAINMLKTEEWATGIKGAFVRDYGGFLGAGSPAINLDATITSIKANIGFDKLQKMREESPTGGALGQVAVMELIALQATLGSLDLRQSPELVIATLENVRDSYNKNMAIVLEQYGAEELKKYGIEYGGAGKSTGNDDPLGIR
ncbi:MAG: hypothetical protein ABGY11_11965, partial [Candidatus Thioglobus sp.]